ncbi:MAG: FAD-dependent monooxygenase, partial [Nannocystaceae bacterium]
MTMKTDHYDVVIIGAGMSGCAVAQALALADEEGQRRILLVDRHEGVSPRFAGELIHPRGAQVLDELGFFTALVEAGAVEIDGFTVLERADGRCVELPYREVPNARPRGLAVHHKTLVRVMRAVVRRRPQVTLWEGYTIEALRRDASGKIVGVTLEDRRARGATRRVEVETDLVIGADGKASATRKLAGIGGERETVGFTLGLSLRDAGVPGATSGNVILGAWGPVLVYPIVREPSGALQYRMTMDLPPLLPAKGKELGAYLHRTFVPFLPSPLAEQTAAAIARADGRFEMAPTVNLPAPRAVLPGLALVGDAAGCSHPITASGMTMGLRDAETLGQQARRRGRLAADEPWIDERCLQRYRAEHDRYVPTRQALATAIYEAFRGGDEGSRAIQRALFAYWASSQRGRARSMALLSCAEGRPGVFLAE